MKGLPIAAAQFQPLGADADGEDTALTAVDPKKSDSKQPCCAVMSANKRPFHAQRLVTEVWGWQVQRWEALGLGAYHLAF